MKLRKQYNVMMIDPPWPIPMAGRKRTGKQKWGVLQEMSYPRMDWGDIRNLLVNQILPNLVEPGVVFLWTVEKFLLQSEWMLEELGFKQHIRLIWDKGNGMAPAFTVRFCHEYLVWFYQQPMLQTDRSMAGVFGSVIYEPSKAHSQKPDAAYDLVEALYPNTKRLDVFSRKPRPGWDQWGNQIDFLKAEI